MKLTLTVAVVTSLALSGCTSFRTVDGASSCKNTPFGDPVILKVDIKEKRNANKKIDDVSRVCARPGDLLQFKIKVKGKNASVEGKEVEDEWIKGGTSNRKAWFWVIVPEDVLEEDEDEALFEYNIHLEDFDSLDPEVRIRRTYN